MKGFTMSIYIRCLLVVVCFLVASPADAVIRYVGTAGSDANSCTTSQTIDTPKRNISGTTGGLACMAAGDVLRIRAGTYVERISSNSQIIPTGTSWGVPVTITTNPGEAAAILRPLSGGTEVITLAHPYIQYIIFDGLVIDATGIENVVGFTNGAHHVRIQNSEIKNANGQGIFSSPGSSSAPYYTYHEFINLKVHDIGTEPNADHGFYIGTGRNLFERNEVYNNATYGFQIYSGVASKPPDENILRYNYIHNNNSLGSGRGGIAVSGNRNLVHNNIIISNMEGIESGFAGAADNKIYNNTIYSNSSWGIQTRPDALRTVIRNNLIFGNGSGISNLGSGTIQSNNQTTDPSFVDAAGANFALQAGSTAINTGTNINGFSVFNGSAPDVGAHETIVFGSAKILNDVTDNKAEITFENNVFPPLLPATGCTGFTARKNNANNILISCVRSAAGVVTLTLTDSYINTDTADFAYLTTTGNVTDSVLIGNTKNQRLNAVGSPNQSVDVSTLAGGGTLPFLEQIEYQFESPGGTESLPNYKAPLNVGIPLPPDKCTVIRPQIVNTIASINSAGYAPFAQRNGAGGYVAIANGPCSSTGICFISGTDLTMPERIVGPTTDQISRTGTFVPGGVQTSSAETPTVALTTAAPRTQFIATLCVGAGNVAGDYFDVRWYRAGVPLDLYTQTPRITIGAYTGRFGAQ